MSKVLSYLKYSLALAWMLFVAFHFFTDKPYYEASFLAWKATLLHIVLMAAVAAALFFIGKAKRKIQLPWIIGLLMLVSLLIGAYQIGVSDFAVIQGGNIVKQGDGVMIVSEEELKQDMQVLFLEGDIVRDAKFALRNLPDHLHGAVQRISFLKALASFSLKTLLNIGGGLLTIWIFMSIGQRLFFSREKKIKLDQRMISYFIGAGGISLSLTLLGILKVYTLWSFLAVLLAWMILSYRQLGETAKFLWSQNVTFEKRPREVLAALGFAVVYFAMLNLDIMRVFPLAWDDANLYMRGARLFAESNFFIQGIGPTAWTVLQSIPWLFIDVMQGSLVLLYATFLVGLGAFFLLARRFLNLSSSLWATTFMALIPMLVFFSTLDTKIEIPLLFSGVASVLALMNWHKNKSNRNLAVLAALVAFTMTIKITAIIFAVVILAIVLFLETKRPALTATVILLFGSYFGVTDQMITLKAFGLSGEPVGWAMIALAGVTVLYSLLKEKPFSGLKNYKAPLVVALTMVAFLLPWMLQRYLEFDHVNLSNLIFGTKNMVRIPREFLMGCVRDDFAFLADYKRYSGPGTGLKGLLLFPWYATMTPELTSFISDLTFVFLAFIPLWILFPKKLFGGSNKWKLLLAFTIPYVIFWALFSSGVSWYGIFMLIPGVLLLFYTVEGKEKWWKYPLVGLLILSMVMSFLLRNHMFVEQRMFAYAIGVNDAERVADNLFPGYNDVVAILDDYKANRGEPTLYRIGTQIKFFLNVADDQVFDDDFLDDFACVNQSREIPEVAQIYKDTGYTHLLFHRGVSLDEGTIYEDAYRARRDELELFLRASKWPVVYDNHDLVLFEIQ